MFLSSANFSLRHRAYSRSAVHQARGLTLMETALATVIVGVAVLALVQLMTVTTQETNYSQKLTNAYMLANHIRESTSSLNFIKLQSLNNVSYNPPIDANGLALSNFGNWRQSITVTAIGDANGQLLNGSGGSYSIVERVRVTISFRPDANSSWTPVATSSWWKTMY